MSLSFLNNNIVYTIIITILVLYSSTIFDNINSFVGNLFNFSLLKILGLLLIIYVAPKDTTIAILLAVSYLVTIYYMINNELFTSSNYESVEKYATNMPSQPPSHAPSHAPSHVPSHTPSHVPSQASMQKKNKVEKYVNSMDNYGMMNNIPNNVQTEMFNNKRNVEHFIPAIDNSTNGNEFDVRLNNVNVNTKKVNYTNQNQPVKQQNAPQSCMSTYVPDYETLSDPCNATATFQGELNAQGLNFPEGFNAPVVGSPL